MTAKKSSKKLTYRQRTFDLQTVKFALARGYSSCAGNEFAVRHFSFVYTGAGSPAVEVRWFKDGSDRPSITIGDTHYHGNGADEHALERLKKFW